MVAVPKISRGRDWLKAKKVGTGETAQLGTVRARQQGEVHGQAAGQPAGATSLAT